MIDVILYSLLGLCIGVIAFIIFGSIIFVLMVLKGDWVDEVYFTAENSKE